ncbi:MAG TPA: histidine kinase, partial [Rubricoccaceae bacterium]
MQLNPHFLFNALNAVSALAGDDPDAVRRLVARLSSLLRRVLDAPPDAEVSLADELAFLRDYLDIQQVRFEGRLAVRESVQPEAFGALVPAFLLQPLVENAVEHGADEAAGGRVEIDARVEAAPGGPAGARRLIVVVRNDARRGGLRGEASERVGLTNTRARLAAHAGPDATLTLRHAPDGTFDAEVALPFHSAAHA